MLIDFRERRKGGRKTGRETSMEKKSINWLPLTCTQTRVLTGNPAGNISVCGTVLQPTEPNWPELYLLFSKWDFAVLPIESWGSMFPLFEPGQACDYDESAPT